VSGTVFLVFVLLGLMISLWTASDDEEEKESYTIDATDCDL